MRCLEYLTKVLIFYPVQLAMVILLGKEKQKKQVIWGKGRTFASIETPMYVRPNCTSTLPSCCKPGPNPEAAKQLQIQGKHKFETQNFQ